ncbi:MAG: hypothetical protein GY861_22520 [bacterium]|nr:hypothetical protein [bacterium]
MGRYNFTGQVSYFLRHHPEEGDLTIYDGGWVLIDELVAAVAHKFDRFSYDHLMRIVQRDRTIAVSEPYSMIRATEGHTFSVNINLDLSMPPEYLYYSTPKRFLKSIRKRGISADDKWVYLFSTIDHIRRSKSLYTVVEIKSSIMFEDDYIFYSIGDDEVWLVSGVPQCYINTIIPAI